MKYYYILIGIILTFCVFKLREKYLAATSPATTMLLKKRFLPMRNNFISMGRPLWTEE